ncbi:DUF397 domain-containing protein [Streptomyces cellulosae]|uniref:DUF397 domain-containing protein n=1 Tax=Streptomyces cellulosae TaxID=1968 RepID=A0ABW7Y1X2_STRCE
MPDGHRDVPGRDRDGQTAHRLGGRRAPRADDRTGADQAPDPRGGRPPQHPPQRPLQRPRPPRRHRDGTERSLKSSYSGNEGGECVEVAAAAGAVCVRDSKAPPSLNSPSSARSGLPSLTSQPDTDVQGTGCERGVFAQRGLHERRCPDLGRRVDE